ncbi:type II toxin-antitoxin system CcdA family antitoxin [Rhizobium alvei]|uniref:Type II toxin-antitoxin system CcdA family antitoxin n=1 Tax=Rhizobium alvei TaxID=1132659 RepID=A0ABT8YQI1_9HYPH|nr:type II toxin-antitoxin system CcdA family antitoxin [Rhizobium alvei]MDO6965544.1 type II toxin-antitoxin system CcdA family antitoxin [Rhizobium alvei]
MRQRASNSGNARNSVDHSTRDGADIDSARLAQHENWLAENAEAIRRENEHTEQHGLPLADLRQF